MELITAVKNGNFELAFNLLQSGYSTKVCDKDNATPLYWSACHGYTNICEILIQAGSDVNTRVSWGSTPLHAAADRGHKACIEVLLDSGATVNARNNRGDTALHIAAYRGHYDIIMTLLNASADVTLRNEKGKTPQQEALEGGHQTIAERINNYSNAVRINQPLTPTTSPRAPDVIQNVLTRQTPQRLLDLQPRCDYENTNCSPRQRIVATAPTILRQSSVETPPPRPPVAISRSVSFNGNQCRHVAFRQNVPEGHFEQRTHSNSNSLDSMNGCDANLCVNDVRRNVMTSECVSEIPVFMSHNDSLSQPSSYLTESSAYSSDASWNNTSLMTSGSENEGVESSDYPTPTAGDTPYLPPRLYNTSVRPNRSSIGSIREICNTTTTTEQADLPTDQTLVLTLEKQLVESYRVIERLSAENDSLKFKCSTLLSRLSDTETSFAAKYKECENVKQLMQSKVRELSEKEAELRECQNAFMPNGMVVEAVNGKLANGADKCDIGAGKRYIGADKSDNGADKRVTGADIHDIDVNKHGFKPLSEHMAKELKEDTLQDVQQILQESLQNHALCWEGGDDLLDAPHREWFPGVDYVILGKQTGRCDDQNIGGGAFPRSVCFLIKHLKTGRKLQLKMLLRPKARSRMLPDETGGHVLEKIGRHPNVTKILHSYEGSTERFKKFLPVSTSSGPLTFDSFSPRTTFLVTEQLQTLSNVLKTNEELKCSGLISTFLAHALYQLVSVLCVLDEQDIVHNNINDGSVLVTDDLQVVLGNFEQAFCLDEKTLAGQEARGAADETELRDYINVAHLARGSQPAVSARSKTADLVNLCKVFGDILLGDVTSPRDADDTLTDAIPSVSPALWRVINGIITQTQPLTSRECLQRIGACLFGPKVEVAGSQFGCRTFMQTRLLHLLSFKPHQPSVASQRVPHTTAGDIRLAVNRHRYELEAHFLCNTAPKQLYQIARTLHNT